MKILSHGLLYRPNKGQQLQLGYSVKITKEKHENPGWRYAQEEIQKRKETNIASLEKIIADRQEQSAITKEFTSASAPNLAIKRKTEKKKKETSKKPKVFVLVACELCVSHFLDVP